MKTIKVETDPKTGDGILSLEDFKDMIDISKVEYYTLEAVHGDYGKALILKFYDSEKKVINCKEDK